MAGAPGGKFQDHYKVLGVDPKTKLDDIRPIYERLLLMFDPEKGSEPNAEQHAAVREAWDTLSDPIAREVYDSVRTGGGEEKPIQFSGTSFFREIHEDAIRRDVLLCVLYDIRRQTPRTPTITYRQLSGILKMNEKDIGLAMWYLKTRSYILVDDRSKFQITADGMDYMQSNPPDMQKVMPYIKDVAVADLEELERDAEAHAAKPVPAPAPTPFPEPMFVKQAIPVEPEKSEPKSVPEKAEEKKTSGPIPKPRPIQILRRPTSTV